ncbi:phage holin family protein [Edwardsiella ictaluri]|nr:holin [Edwardsiella ictaluri]WFO09628.1 phage holin family protein [Edwardsiella ictaluri]
MFNEHERTLFTLALIGAGSAIGRVLLSEEPITWKLFIGRTLLGSGLSMSAAALLIQYPSLSPAGRRWRRRRTGGCRVPVHRNLSAPLVTAARPG